eukprot:sb/3469138/
MTNYKLKLHTMLYLEEDKRQKLLAESHLPNMRYEASKDFQSDYCLQMAPPGYKYLTFKLNTSYDSNLEQIGYTNVGPKGFELPPVKVLSQLSVVVTTIEQAGDLAFLEGLPPGHFSHIFIDEAAQVQECEALIPLQLAALGSTKIVLAGDHMQMEKELLSEEVREILDREREINELFYESNLIPMYRPDRIVPEPLSFYGIQGQEERDTNEFSYFNFIEAREVGLEGGLQLIDLGSMD